MTDLPYGSWPSPITASLIAGGGVSLDGPRVRDSQRWWAEGRPSEGGRVVLVCRDGDEPARDMVPGDFSCRTRVHEYGGGAWFLGSHDVYCANMADQRLYRLPADGADPVAITPEPPLPAAWRYADGVETPDGEWILCVRESHVDAVFDTDPDDEHAPDDGAAIAIDGVVADAAPSPAERGEATVLPEARNEIVAIPVDGSARPRVEVTGPDFVSNPRVSPDGRWVSWIQWNHPNMPWDGSSLCAAPMFDGGRFGNVQVVAGNPHESIMGADWSSDGRLIFASDRSGRWNLHTWRPGAPADEALTKLGDAEIGSAPWVFGLRPWVELSDGRLAAVVTRRAVDALALVGPDGTVDVVDERFAHIGPLAATGDDTIACTVFPGDGPPIVLELDGRGSTARVIREPAPILEGQSPADTAAWMSQANRFDFTADDGSDRHAFFYPPTAPGLNGPAGALPPLIVIGHGGPTTHTDPSLNLKVQFWTTRGFAVLDVNYGGSTGFGRAYRQILDGSWGVSDVRDCVRAAEQAATAGLVDPERMAIRGGSAGGLTVLNALITTDVFGAGTSLYGVADLAALATDTHKFERRYLDNLVGPWPDAAEVYRERSPIEHVAGISCPILVLQGTEDEIVPPSQADAILAAAAANDLPHASIYFEGEQHGFRSQDAIVRSLEAELWFYGRVFDFEPADPIVPIADAVGL